VVVPTTVYIVVAVGVTETVVPDNAPGFQVYVDAPEPVNVAEAPAQIAVGFATAFTVGLETTRDNVLVFVHPVAETPVTV
jgi:hypothetical protein